MEICCNTQTEKQTERGTNGQGSRITSLLTIIVATSTYHNVDKQQCLLCQDCTMYSSVPQTEFVQETVPQTESVQDCTSD